MSSGRVARRAFPQGLARRAAVPLVLLVLLSVLIGAFTLLSAWDTKHRARTPDGERLALTLPLRTYLLSPSESYQVAQAKWVVTRRCLGDRAELLPAMDPPPAPAVDREWWLGRYYYRGQESARVQGFRPTRYSAEGFLSRVDKTAARLGKRAGAVFLADLDACSQRARTAVCAPVDGGSGDSGKPFSYCDLEIRLENEMLNRTYERSLSSAQVTQAAARWDRCMRAAGLRPTGLTTFWDEYPDDTARARTAAVADSGCKRSTGLLADWARAERKEQLAAIRSQAELLHAAVTARRSTLDRAAELFATG